ncbi:hypothetical protein RclHR1_21350001 [Rhizophagus clarus]|uniref:Uncharacterized protein n=1 Tax=Rhizophagus clarus TaxID=94130 RepID=A0A2Z6QTA5_9GLOM|nr:hypothetical protein RclHR1_21350001 [Rhizophagus clarus]
MEFVDLSETSIRIQLVLLDKEIGSDFWIVVVVTEKVRNWKNTSNKKRKVDKSIVGQNTITAFHDSTNPPKARINQINSALVKCFVCCGIAFRIIEHSFFIDLLKELNAGYDPPTREYLSNCLLETELCNVNEKMDEDIKNQQNLTLDVPLKSGVYARLAKTVLIIGKNLGFDLEQSRALCSQLGQYRKKEFSFDLEFGYGFQEPINWWNLIETKSEPESLPIVTLYPFSICPNSASCERESMCKMITYWKSNARKEFSFFSQEMKNKPKLNEIELNKRVTEVLAETDNTDEEEDNEFEDNLSQPVRRTINSEIISHNNVVVLIESIWIENEIDLSNNLILKDIGNISKDLDDDFIDNKKNNNEDIVLTDDEIVDDTNGRGILNYNVDDLFNEYINEN